MTTAVFDLVAAREAVLARLDPIANITVYDGEVPTTPPVDAEGRVHPYLVLYPGGGNATRTALDATSSLTAWSFQVTAVGGDPQRCLWAAAAAASALVDVRLAIPDWVCAPLEQQPTPDMARDDKPRPPRFYVPLRFSTVATPA